MLEKIKIEEVSNNGLFIFNWFYNIILRVGNSNFEDMFYFYFCEYFFFFVLYLRKYNR